MAKMPTLKLLPHLLFLFTTLLVLRVTYAIHDPAYTGIKTKTYQRDPIIAAAFEQQQQSQHQYSPNYQAANERNTYSQPIQGDYYQQQELPLYERSRNTQHERHAAYQGGSNWNDAENAITEYYSGCPSHYTGQLAYAYDCRRFVNCWNGRGHIQSCAPGTVFNAETLECDRPDKVVCGTLSALGTQNQQPKSARYRAGHSLDDATETVGNLCPSGVNGMQPHPTDCTKFINCANGNVHVQNCGPGTAYSKTMMVCDFIHKVDCSGREGGAAGTQEFRGSSSTDVVTCPSGATGLYAHPYDCTKFLNCVSGQTAAIQDCGPGTAFDSANMICDYKDKVNCQIGAGSSSTGIAGHGIITTTNSHAFDSSHHKEGSTSTSSIDAHIMCPEGVNGLFAYPFDYTRFIHCKSGKTAIQNCAPNFVFSISKRFCDEKAKILYADRVTYIVSEVSYEYSHMVNACPPGTDGVHLYPFDCGKYLKCVGGQMFIMACELDTVFSISKRTCNSNQQVDLNDRVLYLREILDQLAVEINSIDSHTYLQCPYGTLGYYPFPFDSTMYLRCQRGQLSIETCVSGSVFSLSKKHCELRELVSKTDIVQIYATQGQQWSSSGTYGYKNNVLETFDHAQLMCPPNFNGYFLHPFDCEKYLNCQNGKLIIESCASGLVFSISRKQCISRNQVEAYDRVEYITETQHEFSTEQRPYDTNEQSDNLVCPKGYTGLYPHAYDCNKYLQCTKDGRTIIENCLSGMVFSISKGYCDYEHKVSANDRSTYARNNGKDGQEVHYNSDGVKITQSGALNCPTDASGMFAHPYDCTKFLSCANGIAIVKSCGPGTAWHEKLQVCDFKDKVNCAGRQAFGRDLGTAVVGYGGEQKIQCPVEINGFYPHPFDYNKYFICHSGRSIVQSCIRGKIFSISRRLCDVADRIRPTDRTFYIVDETTTVITQEFSAYIMCPAQAEGFFIYPFDCSKYIKCSGGHTFIETCATGFIFSMSQRICLAEIDIAYYDRVGFVMETQLLYGLESDYEFGEFGNIVCPAGVTGLYQHPYDWTKYLNCTHGTTVIEACARGSVFSVSKRICDLEANVASSDRCNNGERVQQTDYTTKTVHNTISSSSSKSAQCTPNASGMYAHPYNCTKFLNCANGETHIQDCAPGTAWSVSLEICDFKHKVDCTNRDRSSYGKELHAHDSNTQGSASYDKVQCPTGASGIQAHPHDCMKFLNCANGETHIQMCAPGTAWNIEMEVCDFVANVDCTSRSISNLYTGYEYSYNNNRDSKSYTQGGGSDSLNNHQWGHHESGSRDGSWTTTTQRSTGYNNRWTNMNRPRPDANLYGRQGADIWENQQTSEYADTQRNTETEPSWSGQGSSINRQTPSHSVTFESGSLQPNRNYDHSIKNYRAPLAPFSPNTFNAATTTTTTTTTTRTPNIYYAQPVGSQEESDEIFSNISGGDLAPNFSHTPTTNRQNHSREIPFNYSNNWKPVYNRPSQSPNVNVLPNPNLLAPHRESNSYPHRNVPEPHLMPPFSSDVGQRPLDEDLPGEQADLRQHTINIDNLPGDSVFQIHPHTQPDDQTPSASHRVNNLPVDESNLYGGLQPPQTNYPNHRPSYSQPAINPLGLQPQQSNYPNHRPSHAQSATNPSNESNLYGGLRPPPISTPLYETTTPKNYLYSPTYPTTSVNTYQATQQNVRVQQIYPPLTNASESRAPFDPHYSPSYASVAHSRNVSWPNNPFAFDRKGARNPAASPAEQPEDIFSTTTERHGVSPPAYNRQYYAPPTNALKSNSETVADDNAQLPISDALRMLLQPYFNRSGTVSEDAAAQAESHIMKLVSAQTPSTTSTTERTSSSPSYPSTTPGDDDVELILAGEQHHMITVPTQIGTHEVSPEFHINQQNSQRREENTNWHEHSRDYHLRHPELQSPFKEDERSSIIPTYDSHNHHYHHNHHQHDPNYHHEHSPEFHRRHPNLPNPFEKKQAEPDDSYDVYRPNAESTTLRSYDINIRGSFDSAAEDCQFNCGNGKCVKTFEVCDGVDNCDNRKDEEQCSHLGYEVRLTGGDSTNMGRVEVKILGKWGYVCDDKFGLRDADVVCRELGFNLGASEVRGNSFYPPTEVNFSFMMDEVDCRGNETALKECKFKGWGVNNCGPDEIVGVVCKVPLLKCPNNYWLCSTSKECIPPAFVCDNTPDCADQSDESERVCNSTVEYRLEGGRSANEGRLEVKYRSVWGTVCDDDFSLKEAQVVCNSLGFYGKPTIEKNIFGPGRGPIWLDQVSCYGNETTLDKCNHWTWGEHNCNHTEDVGLRCTAGPPPRRAGVYDGNIDGNDNGQRTEEDTQNALEDLGLYPGQWERSSKAINPQRRCGHFKQDLTDEYEHPEERVVNGTVAKRGRHPWQATIRTRGRGGISSHWCGAVLISKKHLLTAAHCLAGYPKGAYFVRMGDHYANIAESSEVDGYIENWYIHEKFRDQTHMNNDIALIVLKHPVRFNDYVQPICLPEKGTALAENRMCTISGWGSIKSGVSTPSNILRAAQLPILADETCKQSHVYGASLTEGMFCAGYMDESVDACDGDSGGPLICSDDDGETLYGIISWGQHCGYANKPGVYVRVEKYIDWIYEKINIAIQQSAARP